MADQLGSVWEHGENVYPRFRCKYCKSMKRGGGATRFKQHLAYRGSNVVGCSHIPAEVWDYFRRGLDRTAERRKDRARQALRQQEVAGEGNVNMEDDEELQVVMRLSKQDEEFWQRQRMYGSQFEQCVGGSSGAGGSFQGGGGSSQGGKGLFSITRRSMSQKSSGRKRVKP